MSDDLLLRYRGNNENNKNVRIIHGDLIASLGRERKRVEVIR